MEQVYLYEWQWKKLPTGTDSEGLKKYLSEVWESRNAVYEVDGEENTEEDESDLQRYKQGFLRFDDKYISAKNYVGFVQFNGIGINILPKVYAKSIPDPSEHIAYVTSNLLHWLKYSNRIRFPFSEVSFEEQQFDHLLEPFIFIFAEYANRLLEKLPYQRFEEVTESTAFVKGRLAIKDYIKESLITGNFQQIISTYELFQFDNKFNQIIKYVSRILINNSSSTYSRERLQNILFMLDEVEDKVFIKTDCDTIHFSKIYNEWNTILNMSRMFLANNSFKSQNIKQANFCFFVPMELLYEEYVAGVLQKFGGKPIHIQPRYKNLTEEGVFNLKPDIIYDNTFIIDTKYKLLDEFSDDRKYGISQSDLYQMLAYAIRYKKKQIVLIYPDDSGDFKEGPVKLVKEFTIKDEFSNENITIQIIMIDVVSKRDLEIAAFFK